jgi:Protein of unknown function (DUF3616)
VGRVRRRMNRGRPVRLTFSRKVKGKLVAGLSALVQVGDCLLTASDETASLERLTLRPDRRRKLLTYGNHERFSIYRYIARGFGAGSEADIEGLAFDGRYVWAVGSHSLVRPQPKRSARTARQLQQLQQADGRLGRALLARIPVDKRSGTLRRSIGTGDRACRAASLPVGPTGTALTRVLARDSLLRPFLALPSKDNGFDIEGIALFEERIYLGLRGPVLGGWALILEIKVVEAAPGRLGLHPVSSSGAHYHKHLLHLRGLGVRDVCVDGSDLLVLAGPTMKLDGPALVYRWRDFARHRRDSVTFENELDLLLRLPVGDRADHPEGMTVVRTAGRRRALLIVFEKTSKERRLGPRSVDARLFSL